MLPFLLSGLLSLLPLVQGQDINSFPQQYPGIPNDDYIFNSSNQQQWQNYYRVNVTSLPNATECTMPSSFAGNVPVNRPGIQNDTLFFWALETSPGSLTNASSNEPWMVWLNGGPGSSSLVGLFFEHGPCLIADNFSLAANPFSIHHLADIFYVDQPVGTGYSTASKKGYIPNEDQMGEDFMGFLANLVEIFPSLKTRPFYLIGEILHVHIDTKHAYEGTYIPYITKTYFGMENPPVQLKHFAIGDGSMGSIEEFEDATMVAVLETYPQLIDYDIDVYKYFREQLHLCGYDLNLTFPQTTSLPTLRPEFIGFASIEDENILSTSAIRKNSRSKNMDIFRKMVKGQNNLSKRDVQTEQRKRQFQAEVNALKRSPSSFIARRDLSGRANGTIDPFYECQLLDEVIDYALNFTEPWNECQVLPDKRTVDAIHAPQSSTNVFGDPSPAPIVFFSELATNSSQRGVSWTFFSGQADFLVASMSTIATIQNTTFGGTRGFTKPPGTAWYGQDGQLAGVVHQERNVSFLLFQGAGHLLSQWQPNHYQTAIREFVLGNNTNGSMDASGNLIGTPFALSHAFNIQAEDDPIFTGSGTTLGSTTWPSATIASWNSAIAPFITNTPTAGSNPKNGFVPLGSGISLGSLLCQCLLMAGALMFVY
ncbi:hypothetical protein Clacol_004399 [Clathrus columnatus]|uniref:Serine carboxypeptidase n=1 Tax=Clathrus columnatus TaxID=1419009 RepID=A0AAV5A9M1_9AGAM|nr:hypothetical protein Clacol_004399 [Clathrus columnatus]